MKRQYNLIPEKDCFIAIPKNTIDKTTSLENLILKMNDFTTAIWSYQVESTNRKGFLVHLDSFFYNEDVHFSNKGTLFTKEYEGQSFSLFSNKKIQDVYFNEKNMAELTDKAINKIPRKMLPGVFYSMYKRMGKYIFFLNIDACFKAYKHLI